ncbi:methyl-accepting chemotaxis protein [Paludibacterium yongneupense]|uniref:methyl-accepting chemotaxis protein n=1 Tax=Paludibacterium yongneupense TaxID=400061 RepID=UPI0004132614|nr:methyl-accepting chemotaxis protein [Paludibacterium yongneupense]
MKKNLPITDVETILPEGEFIYSRTDLKGVVTEANDVFLTISGFDREEIIGKSHNIVRHPDIPEAAFEDMWRDLKQGLPWRGVVKNRRKDGGFYWVIANISPVREQGRVVGYQSVRSRPSREQIAAATAAYARINAGARGLEVRHGQAVKRRARWLRTMLSLDFSIMVLTTLALASAAAGLAGLVWSLPAAVPATIAVLLLVSALYFLFAIALPLRRNLGLATHYLDSVLSSGDLRLQPAVPGLGPVAQLARRCGLLVSSLQATIQGMDNVACEMHHVSGLAAKGASGIRESCDEQSQSSASTAAAVEEITVSLAEVAERSKLTEQSASAVGERARAGAELSLQAKSAITGLAGTVHESVGKIEVLSQRSSEISRVTHVIQEIADQTNLLALNASIEAARAGEQGRGFAVVADEVRKLAERTRGATEEIGAMVATIQSETNDVVEGMRLGAEQVQASGELVHSLNLSLTEINGEMVQTVGMAGDMSLATLEQSRAVQNIADHMQQISAVTEQNLSRADAGFHRSQLLSRLVERMEKAVRQYGF